MIATVLLTQFANRDTGRCFPGNASIATATGSSLPTVKRLLRALEAAGWIVRVVTSGRGRKAAIRFTSPRQLGRPEARPAPSKGVNPAPRPAAEKGSILARKGVNPEPPYRRPEPTLTKRARGGARARPDVDPVPDRGPALSYRLIRFDDVDGIAAWVRWLAGRGSRPLRTVAVKSSDATGRGYLVPLRYPPEPGRADAERDVMRWLSWRLGCLEQVAS